MSINLVYHLGHPWTVAAGWEKDLRDLGLLNISVRCTESNQFQSFADLHSHPAELTIFMMGDSHLRFLHDSVEKANFLRKLPGIKICICWESIINSRFEGSTNFAMRAMTVFDGFGYSDERDLDYFKKIAANKVHFYFPFAATRDSLSDMETHKHNREKKVVFFGKFSNLGVNDTIYKERRDCLNLLLKEPWFCLQNPIDTTHSIGNLKAFISTFEFSIHLPTNDHVGFTPRAFEVIAFGCVLIHPTVNESLAPRMSKVLRPWEHYIPCEIHNEDWTHQLWEMLGRIPREKLDEIKRNAWTHVITNHSVGARVHQLATLFG
jgi:hypothetical protein